MLKFLSLFVILNNKGIKIFGAADLEFERTVSLLLDGHTAGIFPSSGDEEFFHVLHLLRLLSRKLVGRNQQFGGLVIAANPIT